MDLSAFRSRVKGITWGDLFSAPTEGENRDITTSISKTVKVIHQQSSIRIFEIAEKLYRGGISEDCTSTEQNERKNESHDFQLGDWLKISFSLPNFKYLQEKNLGWNNQMNLLLGHRGVVTMVTSKYDQSIRMLFPDVFTECTLYAPLLKKSDSVKCSSRWKPSDMVKLLPEIGSKMIRQAGFTKIPYELRDKKGCVTAITNTHVQVTFDEKQSYAIPAAALIPSDDSTPIQTQTIEHARKFLIGERVKIIKNVKKLIGNQEKFAWWHPNMTLLRGKEVVIVDMQLNGMVTVQPECGKTWALHPGSILHLDEVESEHQDELDFVPDDIVRIKTPSEFRTILKNEGIPLSFLDYLRLPAKITLVDEDLDFGIRFNADQYIKASEKSLRKATPEEREMYESVENAVNNFKINDKVHLDVGPPNYVREILAQKVDGRIIAAMTESATLVGFVSPDFAVIKYGDGKNGEQYKIKKKYLTLPEKFDITGTKETMDLKTVQSIQDEVLKCVHQLHTDREQNCVVQVLSMSAGQPPSVILKVQSSKANPLETFEWLREKSNWEVEQICEGHLMIKGVDGHRGKIQVTIFFNDEELSSVPPVEKTTSASLTTLKEHGFLKVPNEPITGDRNECEGKFAIENFRYLRLSDPHLARDLYFPYVVHGDKRTPVQQPVFMPKPQQRVMPQIRKIVDDVQSFD